MDCEAFKQYITEIEQPEQSLAPAAQRHLRNCAMCATYFSELLNARRLLAEHRQPPIPERIKKRWQPANRRHLLFRLRPVYAFLAVLAIAISVLIFPEFISKMDGHEAPQAHTFVRLFSSERQDFNVQIIQNKRFINIMFQQKGRP